MGRSLIFQMDLRPAAYFFPDTKALSLSTKLGLAAGAAGLAGGGALAAGLAAGVTAGAGAGAGLPVCAGWGLASGLVLDFAPGLVSALPLLAAGAPGAPSIGIGVVPLTTLCADSVGTCSLSFFTRIEMRRFDGSVGLFLTRSI